MLLGESIKQNGPQFLLLLALTLGLYAPMLYGMAGDWYHDANYSHGFLVPFIAGYFLWRNRRRLLESELAPSLFGLPLVVLALCLLLAATLGNELFTGRASLLLLVTGMVLFLFGRRALAAAWLPIAYLLFMVPLPYLLYDSFAFPLKQLVSYLSVEALQSLGVTVLREGNVIMFPSVSLEVADACSGVRSVLSLLALSVAYAFYLPLTSRCRLLVVLAALPLSVVGNALRVILTGLLAQRWGSAAAQGLFHECAGLAVFALTLALLLMLGASCRRVTP
jgi:exosortase